MRWPSFLSCCVAETPRLRCIFACASTSPSLICSCGRRTSILDSEVASVTVMSRWRSLCKMPRQFHWFIDSLHASPQLARGVIAGLIHSLVVAGLLPEALQLHLLVWRLSKVQVVQSDGLPRPLLYLKGLRVLFTIVGDGYGATEDKVWVVKTCYPCARLSQTSLMHLLC